MSRGNTVTALLRPVDTVLADIVQRGQDSKVFGRPLPASILSQVAFATVFAKPLRAWPDDAGPVPWTELGHRVSLSAGRSGAPVPPGRRQSRRRFLAIRTPRAADQRGLLPSSAGGRNAVDDSGHRR
jgi:hypothetical protein